ncbi:MAG: aminoacetone oxidase family FAD-binding enzyme [Clostridiales Family XIII bacterium]|nr:aminoacetone oxidase family FAD-binding enzyme [Clostridiales Family XIII bacterium]
MDVRYEAGDYTPVVAIIGGGASGMAAAIAAAGQCRSPVRIVCFEKNDEPGRKILATGNGRCNLSNRECAEADAVIEFFRRIGIMVREEDGGRLYPFSGQATAVRDALKEAALRAGVQFRFNTQVTAVTLDAASLIGRELPSSGALSEGGVSYGDDASSRGFKVITGDGGALIADAVILAPGGKAGIQYGSSGDGYKIARGLGHSIVSPLPSLVQMVCAHEEEARLALIKGVRAKGKAVLLIDGRFAAEVEGEIQFTGYGLSGICIFDLSRHMREAAMGAQCGLKLDLAPEFSMEELVSFIEKGTPAGLAGLLPSKLADLIMKEGAGNSRVCADLVKGLEFSVSGTKGWKEAQTTSGGVPLGEVRPDSMESIIIPGLFFAGEILDYDGRCGGFNLNWAWSTGIKAGIAAVAAVAVE